MNKEFVLYTEAETLKELGFDESCIAIYLNGKSNNEGYLKELALTICNEKGVGDSNWTDCVQFLTYNNSKIYKQYTTAPTFRQAFRFFRKIHDLVGNVYANASGYLFEIHDSALKGGTHRYDSGYTGPNDSGVWDEHEDAEQACLVKLIDIIKARK